MNRPRRTPAVTGHRASINVGAIAGAFGAGSPDANPAYGAETPGDVDPNYKGDPSTAIAKFGSENPYKPAGFFSRMAGNRANEYNEENRAAFRNYEMQKALAGVEHGYKSEELAQHGKLQESLADKNQKLALELARINNSYKLSEDDHAQIGKVLGAAGIPHTNENFNAYNEAIKGGVPDIARSVRQQELNKANVTLTPGQTVLSPNNTNWQQALSGAHVGYENKPQFIEVGGKQYPTGKTIKEEKIFPYSINNLDQSANLAGKIPLPKQAASFPSNTAFNDLVADQQRQASSENTASPASLFSDPNYKLPGEDYVKKATEASQPSSSMKSTTTVTPLAPWKPNTVFPQVLQDFSNDGSFKVQPFTGSNNGFDALVADQKRQLELARQREELRKIMQSNLSY